MTCTCILFISMRQFGCYYDTFRSSTHRTCYLIRIRTFWWEYCGFGELQGTWKFITGSFKQKQTNIKGFRSKCYLHKNLFGVVLSREWSFDMNIFCKGNYASRRTSDMNQEIHQSFSFLPLNTSRGIEFMNTVKAFFNLA